MADKKAVSLALWAAMSAAFLAADYFIPKPMYLVRCLVFTAISKINFLQTFLWVAAHSRMIMVIGLRLAVYAAQTGAALALLSSSSPRHAMASFSFALAYNEGISFVHPVLRRVMSSGCYAFLVVVSRRPLEAIRAPKNLLDLPATLFAALTGIVTIACRSWIVRFALLSCLSFFFVNGCLAGNWSTCYDVAARRIQRPVQIPFYLVGVLPDQARRLLRDTPAVYHVSMFVLQAISCYLVGDMLILRVIQLVYPVPMTLVQMRWLLPRRLTVVEGLLLYAINLVGRVLLR